MLFENGRYAMVDICKLATEPPTCRGKEKQTSLNDGGHIFLVTAGKQFRVGYGSWPDDSVNCSRCV